MAAATKGAKVEETETLVQKTTREFEARLAELDKKMAPYQTEADEIREALDGITGRRKRATRGPNRGGGGRAKQFFEVVQANPGITIAEAAKKMGVGPNYLYRLAGNGLEDGTLTKGDNGGYTAVAVETPESEASGGDND